MSTSNDIVQLLGLLMMVVISITVSSNTYECGLSHVLPRRINQELQYFVVCLIGRSIAAAPFVCDAPLSFAQERNSKFSQERPNLALLGVAGMGGG